MTLAILASMLATRCSSRRRRLSVSPLESRAVSLEQSPLGPKYGHRQPDVPGALFIRGPGGGEHNRPLERLVQLIHLRQQGQCNPLEHKPLNILYCGFDDSLVQNTVRAID
jgi:hypothetical protein